ncbi:MAG: response regulator transcription factor [Kiritimatiellae bacterium]|nr:response regulator transcription factor [Kiritimatiellia bacterium]MBQ3341431.1 response regulator transcription factor [Kiritimatiellia bacterium]MBQ6327872.1 response regulator transcription factor [Kiritimatiellia bacterium]
MNNKIKVLIADDHAIVRLGLSALLSSKKDIEVVGQSRNGEAVVHDTLRLSPDVVIMDLMMPKMDGIAATAEIKARRPETKIIILTTFATSDGIIRALEAGATGAILKNAENNSLVTMIRKVAAGESVVAPDVEALLQKDPPVAKLTLRQTEVLESLCRGLTNKDIAKQFNISDRSVAEHVEAILAKIGASNRTEAAVIALRKHLLKI